MDGATLSTDPNDGICPWCSAAISTGQAICSSCGAILISDEVSDLPGVTAIDPLVTRGVKSAPPRSRLLSWISGEYPESTGPAVDPQALAPPDPEVQREILRLELEAEVANLRAEADSIRSDALYEGRTLDLGGEAPEAGGTMSEALSGDTPALSTDASDASDASDTTTAPSGTAADPTDGEDPPT